MAERDYFLLIRSLGLVCVEGCGGVNFSNLLYTLSVYTLLYTNYQFLLLALSCHLVPSEDSPVFIMLIYLLEFVLISFLKSYLI